MLGSESQCQVCVLTNAQLKHATLVWSSKSLVQNYNAMSTKYFMCMCGTSRWFIGVLKAKSSSHILLWTDYRLALMTHRSRPCFFHNHSLQSVGMTRCVLVSHFIQFTGQVDIDWKLCSLPGLIRLDSSSSIDTRLPMYPGPMIHSCFF